MDKNLVVNIENVYLKSDRGKSLFEDITFRLENGKTAIISGSAGSGKSLLVQLLIGERFADTGSVTVLGKILKKNNKKELKKVRQQVGGVGGMFVLIPHYTVSENIVFPLILNGERKAGRKEKLLKILTEFSLLKQAGEYPDSLTRVENTMVQFARASIANQPLLIIDEPAAGLDANTYLRIVEFLKKAAVSGRSTVILSSERPQYEIPGSSFYQLENGKIK